ncbi:MAG: hypothetical protein J0H68_04115 [Sphingobacteriia bacterium]|nr:hypothetical protein [Sphingobacteriia bacterium]
MIFLNILINYAANKIIKGLEKIFKIDLDESNEVNYNSDNDDFTPFLFDRKFRDEKPCNKAEILR